MTTAIEPFTRLISTCVVLPAENVDTDQIIPARFLKTVERRGLGAHLFADWRADDQGNPRREFPLNSADASRSSILVAGHNFGCGSSREHAPWALLDFGFRAVISTGFADIFRNNSLKTGLLPIALSRDAHATLLELLSRTPNAEVTIDLESQTVALPPPAYPSPHPSSPISHPFHIDPFARHCLLNGVDELGFLLAEDAAIAAYESSHPARIATR
ncbi:MAG TPA: 3-isopropylmalate dehydratase small subunit [Gemmatimonadaceae bacterium]|jgi:3-isopropylmalate/(R)-2-methylmalate dehydratase small subunit|nr:3-isopropylmalate dehydratase small subunit [Gemmatimonadaceae bacterium]